MVMALLYCYNFMVLLLFYGYVITLFICTFVAGVKAEVEYTLEDLLTMNLSELTQLPVVSASRQPEAFFTSPASIYVLDKEDIRYSSAESISDLLDSVPGVFNRQLSRQRTTVSVRNDSELFFNH